MILRVYESCNGNETSQRRAETAACLRAFMRLSPLALVFFLLATATLGHAQTFAPRDRDATQVMKDATADQAVAARAIFLLKRLADDVIVYRSLGEFEQSGKLARVSFDSFKADLDGVSAQVDDLTVSLSDNRLKTDLRNTLASYQDGAFWWRKVYQPRVINVSSLSSINTERGPADTFFAANIPYTVTIHWRQASTYLERAIRDAGRL